MKNIKGILLAGGMSFAALIVGARDAFALAGNTHPTIAGEEIPQATTSGLCCGINLRRGRT